VEVVAGLKKVGTGTNTPVGGDEVILWLVRVDFEFGSLCFFDFTLCIFERTNSKSLSSRQNHDSFYAPASCHHSVAFTPYPEPKQNNEDSDSFKEWMLNSLARVVVHDCKYVMARWANVCDAAGNLKPSKKLQEIARDVVLYSWNR
jgi:hypothetical protein